MKYLGASEIEAAISYEELIPSLEEAFGQPIKIPKRHHHDFPNPGQLDSTLLLMPAWVDGQSLGVKVVTVSPENGARDLPSIHGVYLYFDAVTGEPLVSMEAKTLTKIRTAATSALASSRLSNPDSTTMLMVGTGALAPELIKAHVQVRPKIENVLVWGRSPEKALQVCAAVPNGIEAKPIEQVEDHIAEADIISVATLSPTPLIKGAWLRKGQHLDLVGSYRPDMREADDGCLTRSSVFVDTFEGATTESGDLVIPLKNNVIEIKDICGDLKSLCTGGVGRRSADEITYFKSVGHALEDLVAARIVYSNTHGKK